MSPAAPILVTAFTMPHGDTTARQVHAIRQHWQGHSVIGACGAPVAAEVIQLPEEPFWASAASMGNWLQALTAGAPALLRHGNPVILWVDPALCLTRSLSPAELEILQNLRDGEIALPIAVAEEIALEQTTKFPALLGMRWLDVAHGIGKLGERLDQTLAAQPDLGAALAVFHEQGYLIRELLESLHGRDDSAFVSATALSQ